MMPHVYYRFEFVKNTAHQGVKMCIILLILASVILLSTKSYGITISGPANVCPGSNATYTATFNGVLGYQTWKYYDDYTNANNPSATPTATGSPNVSNGTFSINITVSNNPSNGLSASNKGALVVTAGIDPGMQYGEAQTMFITRESPVPDQINGGLITVCSAGEQINLSVSALPLNTCGFCGIYQWLDENSFAQLTSGASGPSSNIQGTNSATLIAPNPLNGSGYVSTVQLRARYDLCPTNNTSGSQSSRTPVFVGTPSVSNGRINGNTASGGTVFVPSGYANLTVNIAGGGSTNWYIANGSGSVSPSGSNCSISFSNFVRVIVDASNRCGTGGSWTFYLSTQEGYYGYRIGPNPANDKLSVIMDYKEMAGDFLSNIALYDSNNKLRYSASSDQIKKFTNDKNTFDLITSKLPRGGYFLHIRVGDEIVKQQITLE